MRGHQLDAGNRDRRILEVLEACHHSDTLLHARWSCSIKLFRYFDDRSFVSAGNQPSAFSSRTAR
jgi:hypothetical protein